MERVLKNSRELSCWESSREVHGTGDIVEASFKVKSATVCSQATVLILFTWKIYSVDIHVQNGDMRVTYSNQWGVLKFVGEPLSSSLSKAQSCSLVVTFHGSWLCSLGTRCYPLSRSFFSMERGLCLQQSRFLSLFPGYESLSPEILFCPVLLSLSLGVQGGSAFSKSILLKIVWINYESHLGHFIRQAIA